MVSPLWLLPPLVVPLALGAWLLPKADVRADRFVSRVARVLFGRFVSENQERRLLIESAFIDRPYHSYAAMTLLFTVLGFLAGAVTSGYVTAGVLVIFERFVVLLTALPSVLVDALGVSRDFELVLSPLQRWGILLASGLGGGLLTATGAYLLRWKIPESDAEVRRRSIDEGLPRTTAFMYALSRGGVEFPEIVRTLSTHREVYGESADEMSVVVRQIDLFGRDVITALRRVAERTPSEQFKTFAENLASVLQSGSSLPEFLNEQYERFQDEAEERQSEILEVLATIAEGYVTILVAGVLFLITILLIFGLTTTDTLQILKLIGYLVIPLANAGFAVFLGQRLEALGIARQGGGEVLDRMSPETPQRADAPTETARPDGGALARDEENRAVLAGYDRIADLKHTIRNPLETLLWRPAAVLYVTVPVAVGAILLRLPEATRGTGINVRVLDDVIIQSVLLVLASYAIVRHLYTRRIDNIEAATPELLERLASLNESGMSIVEGIDRVRGSDLGILTPEIDRIWRDLQYGSNVSDALIRFGRRVRTTAITRVVILVTNAMAASGQVGPVLRIAAEQSRAELRLRRQRRGQMLTYLVVIYISFMVFLVIIVAVNEVLVPSLPESVPDPGSGGGGIGAGAGAGAFSRIGEVNKAAYTLVFFHTALIQAVTSGFIGGQLGEGTLKDGTKHATVLLVLAYVLFLLVSSPVASIGATGAVSTGDTVRIDSASLSTGGYVVVYGADGIDSEILGHSSYLQSGTQTDIVVPLDRPITSNATVYVVPHLDTNGNQVFDYPGPPLRPDASQTDRPYPPSTAQGSRGVEVELTYTG